MCLVKLLVQYWSLSRTQYWQTQDCVMREIVPDNWHIICVSINLLKHDTWSGFCNMYSIMNSYPEASSIY